MIEGGDSRQVGRITSHMSGIDFCFMVLPTHALVHVHVGIGYICSMHVYMVWLSICCGYTKVAEHSSCCSAGS